LPLDTLGADLDLPVPSVDGLEEVSLAAVRRAGGVERLGGAGDLDADERRMIDGVATLDLTTDLQTASTLVERGFTDQVTIAETPLSEFQDTIDGALDTETAARVHTTARAQTALIDVAMTEERTARRNGIAGEAASPGHQEVTDDVE
jgi:hypothetical protein